MEIAYILQLKSIKKLLNEPDSNVYLVGGYVRDYFLGKQSKDIDIVVSGLEIDKIIEILSPCGYVDIVGKSFGVIKHKPNDSNLELDIALPRKERKLDTEKNSHRNFEIITDPYLSIEKELERRDCTINSIAYDIKNKKIIDPFNGIQDIAKEVIRATSPLVFIEDPLRLARCIQFSARFDFDIEEQTFQSIKKNAHLIKEISGERIYIELEKIVNKGNKQKGLELLIETKLFKEIFDIEFKQNLKEIIFEEIDLGKDMPDFIFSMLRYHFDNPHIIYKNILKGELSGEKKIQALNIIKYEHASFITSFDRRRIIHDMYKISPISIDSNILSSKLKDVAISMKRGEYPLTTKDLAINGDDLLGLGYKGKQIGDIISEILLDIYRDNLKNNKSDLLEYVKNKQN